MTKTVSSLTYRLFCQLTVVEMHYFELIHTKIGWKCYPDFFKFHQQNMEKITIGFIGTTKSTFSVDFTSRQCLGPIAWPMLGACSSHSEAHARLHPPNIWHSPSTSTSVLYSMSTAINGFTNMPS